MKALVALHTMLSDDVKRLRKEQAELQSAVWKLWERTEEHFDRIHAAVRDSGPSQAADIAKVCLDRMAQVALRSNSTLPPIAPTIAPAYAVPVAGDGDDWAEGSDTMELKG
jgi:hypothetical protein